MRNQMITLAVAIAASSVAGAQTVPNGVPATPSNTAPPSSVPATPPITTPPSSQTVAPGQTQTTPGQSQTSPGEASDVTPAQTGQTPSGQTVPSADAPVAAATSADVKSGVSVYDQKGDLVGKIDSVGKDGPVLSTGKVRVAIPVSSFAKSEKGLVISSSKAELDAQAKATAKPSKSGKSTK
jgi:hypothetical protein